MKQEPFLSFTKVTYKDLPDHLRQECDDLTTAICKTAAAMGDGKMRDCNMILSSMQRSMSTFMSYFIPKEDLPLVGGNMVTAILNNAIEFSKLKEDMERKGKL